MVNLIPPPELQFLDANGVPLAGGSVATYLPATFTPSATWSDYLGTVPNSNPVILDSAGRCVIFGTGTYRWIVKDVLGNTIYDGVTAAASDVLGAVFLPNGTLTTQGPITAGGAIFATGAVTAIGGRLRATYGARGSGDLNAGATLQDFTRTYTGTNNGFTIAPDGTIDQVCTALVNSGGGPVTTTVTLPLAFPGNILDATICFGSTATPPGAANPGSIAVQPASPATVLVTTNYGGAATPLSVVIRARGY